MEKLVRDLIPTIMLTEGTTPIVRKAKDKDEYWKFLKAKLIEEAMELFEAKTENEMEELADILTVIEYIKKEIDERCAKLYNHDRDRQLAILVMNKKRDKGGFDLGIIMKVPEILGGDPHANS